jgi:hippurate hydrolase
MMIDTLKKYRQDLHQIPELGFEVHKTRQYILDHLKGCSCEITEVSGGVCAFFQSRELEGNGRPREKTIALRSDMDALPVGEETGVPYRSVHEGAMHACGHDGHMAMLLALADELETCIHSLSHNVLLIFQPAEETTGGAGDICASGILSRYHVKRIYGFHLWPMLEKHRIGSRAKEFMAKSSEIDIIIHGKSAHCAYPDQGIDALAIGCELINALYQMERIELPENEFRLLKFGKMTSGTVRNAIAAETALEGTLRCFSEKTGAYLFNRMTETASQLEEKYGCRIIFHRSDGHPPVINDAALFLEARTILSEFGFHTFEIPFMLSEDFSFYQHEVPGLFLFLGTGTGIPLHSNHFNFDEEVLLTGLNAYLKLLHEVVL